MSAPGPAVRVCRLTKRDDLYANPPSRITVPLLRHVSPRLPGVARAWADRFVAARHTSQIGLSDVSFEVRKGESLAIIGRNGSGKSTLLQILAGTLPPTEGVLAVHGRCSALLELGSGFNPEYTGRENVHLTAAILGLSPEATRTRMEFIEEFADLGESIERPLRTYSSGMSLRLAFSIAISVDPEILIVDEALAVGDIFFQEKCFRYLREDLRGATRILVTHSMQAVTALANRVLILSKGEVVFDGDPLEGVAFYTRQLHIEQGWHRLRSTPAPTQGLPPEPVPDDLPWTPLDEAKVGGEGRARITAVAILVNGRSGETVIQAGDEVEAHVQVHCIAPMKNLIFGYLVRNWTGLEIFGENSFPLGGQNLPQGPSRIRMAFRWPQIAAGPHFLTLGIGQGEDAYEHNIQCWAHNVAVWEAVRNGPPVHGIFNNPLTGFDIALRPAARALS